MPLCGRESHERLQWREWKTNAGKVYVEKNYYTNIAFSKKLNMYRELNLGA